ncbi:RecX family transcriptional regulator [Candidatus Daviesbacteria bacterium]|nr:RecX family transcriptional regulator [Candidatus Daviesbacteria bacterium]
MPKITAVEQQKESKYRFNIFLDGVFAFGADEDLVVEHRLVIGKLIDTPLLEKLLFEAEVGKLMERMYRLWNIRPRSEREVRNYFRIKGKELISELAVELVIKKLKQKGLLNDEAFAKAWIEQRRRSKKKGKIALKAELFQKGVDKKIIEEALEEKTSEESEEELAMQVLGKKAYRWQSLSYLEKKKKAYEYLTRQGFDYEIISETIEKLLKKG